MSAMGCCTECSACGNLREVQWQTLQFVAKGNDQRSDKDAKNVQDTLSSNMAMIKQGSIWGMDFFFGPNQLALAGLRGL